MWTTIVLCLMKMLNSLGKTDVMILNNDNNGNCVFN